MTKAANISVQDALHRLAELNGEFVWLSSIELGYVLRLEVGDPRLRIEEKLFNAVNAADPTDRRRIVRPVGRWSLFVGGGHWQIKHGEQEIHRLNATYADSSVSVRRQLTQLDGQKIVDIRWQRDLEEWVFDFDLGASVSIRAAAGETDHLFSEQWLVFSSRGGVLSCVCNDMMALEGEF